MLYWRHTTDINFVQIFGIKTYGSELQDQGGSGKQCPDGLEVHTHEYFTGTRTKKIKNAITKEP